MERSRSYWIGTTRRDGRPHAAPVWGIWMDERLLFSTGGLSQKARNLVRSGEVVAHLESSDYVVINEGTGVAVSDTATRTRFDRAYLIKYHLDPSTRVDPDSMVYKIEPRTIMAWIEKDFPSTATRWRFD